MADIYAIGFQEIVDLNASNIMAASSDNAKACEYHFWFYLSEIFSIPMRKRMHLLVFL